MEISSNLRSQFLVNKDITFLNFGSFGACPKPIFEDYQKWQLELEREPVQFITVTGPQYIKESREALASYIHANPDDIVFTTNPSYAVNIIAKGIGLSEGDEVLTTDLEYGACDKTWQYYADKTKFTYRRQAIQLPLVSKEQFIDDFFKGCTSKTKVIFISHITSSTALIFPVKEICEIAKQKGLFTIVDGAHAPAHVPLNLGELKADAYIGACHKWMMSPKGCSFLYLKKEFQQRFDPLVISWGYKALFPSGSIFQDYHQMQGTRDFSAFLTVPKCIEFMNAHQWNDVSAACRNLVHSNAERFADLLETATLAPVADEFIGQMLSLEIKTSSPEELQKTLFKNYKIEIPVMRHGNRSYIRFSINAFNTQEDLDKLYIALNELIQTHQII